MELLHPGRNEKSPQRENLNPILLLSKPLLFTLFNHHTVSNTHAAGTVISVPNSRPCGTLRLRHANLPPAFLG